MSFRAVVIVMALLAACDGDGDGDEHGDGDGGTSRPPSEEPTGCHVDCFGAGVSCEGGQLLDHTGHPIDDPTCSMDYRTACQPREIGVCSCASDEELTRYGFTRLQWSLSSYDADVRLLCRDELPAEPGDRCSSDECRFTLPRYDAGSWLPPYYLECEGGTCVEVEPPEGVGAAPCEFDSDCSLGWQCVPTSRGVRGPGSCAEGLEPYW